MARRVFNMESEKDVKELFELLPENTERILRTLCDNMRLEDMRHNFIGNISMAIKINWGSKQTVTRPVDKTKWIGKLCRFWDTQETRAKRTIGILKEINLSQIYNKERYITNSGNSWDHCEPLFRDEIEFVDD